MSNRPRQSPGAEQDKESARPDGGGSSKAAGSMTLGMGMGGGGPGGGMGGGPGGPPPGGGPGGGEGSRGGGMMPNQMPPISIQLELTNHSDKSQKVQIWELNSELGNFAVRPDVLTIEPGAKASPNLMTSYLGLASGQVPVTLILRLQGKEERRVVVIGPTPPPAKE